MLPPEEVAEIQTSHQLTHLPYWCCMGKATEITTAAQHRWLADFLMGACNYACTSELLHILPDLSQSPKNRQQHHTAAALTLASFLPAVTFCALGTDETQSSLLLPQVGYFSVDSYQLGLVQRHIAGAGSRAGTNSSRRREEKKESSNYFTWPK